MTDNSEKIDNNQTEKTISPIRLPVKRLDGTTTGEEVELDPRLFGVEYNDHVLYLAVKAELHNRRQGTHSTLSRSMVRGGGRKPWRQKGRGAARAGTNRSPIWRGGGITFGPQPHDYNMKLPHKVKRIARRMALTKKAQSDAISLIEDFDLDAPRTKSIAQMLHVFDAVGQSILLMLEGNKPTIVKSCRNIPRLEVRDAMTASTYDILRAKKLIISRRAIDNLVGGLADEK